MNKISFKEFTVEYIHKRHLKHTYISIDKYFKISVKTPYTSKAFVMDLLLEKESWIRKQILKKKQNSSKEVLYGHEVLLFGDILSVNSDDVIFLHEKLQNIEKNTQEAILQCYREFYEHLAHLYLPQRVSYFALLMGLHVKKLQFKKLKSRWGSCNTLGVVVLNIELLKVKKELIDYVIVHELAHLQYMNHSKSFHALVQKYLPDANFLKKELKNISIR